MKKNIFIATAFQLCVMLVQAQKIIPFQYQSQKQWNNDALWGYMNEDRKIVFTPFSHTLTPIVYNGKYRNCNEGIKDITTGLIVIDSINAIGTYDIKGNLLSIKNPKYLGYYSRFSVINIITKKTITNTALSFTNIPNYTLVRNFDETDINHREGVIDENGKEIIPLKYDKIKGNGYGFFAVYDNDDIYLYSTKGKMLNKVPYSFIDIKATEDVSKRITKAQRKLQGTPTIYENILLDVNGIEIGKPFYTKDSKHPFDLYAADDYIFKNRQIDIFKTKECVDDSKMKIDVIIDNRGKIIFNTDEDRFHRFLNAGLWYVINKDDSKFLINTINDKKLALKWNSNDEIYSADENSILTVEYNYGLAINFYEYNNTENKITLAERATYDAGIKLDKVITAYNKYYVVTAKNKVKLQYETFIYNTQGKLILKDDAAIYKLDDDKKMLIKYLAGANYTELYLTYLDENLKPYSFIID